MQEFHMELNSFEQIQSFVRLAAEQPFEIRVGNDHQRINGKDLMGMFSLDYERPVCVSADCDPESFSSFCAAVENRL